MTKTCTVPGCENKHLAKGLCTKHYSQRYRRSKSDEKYGIEEEVNNCETIPKYTLPEEIKIGVEGPNSLPKDPAKTLGPDGKPVLPVQYAIGTLQIEMMWEVLNKWAPNSAVKLELTPVQRQALDQAFIAAGLTTTNPWLVIISIVAFPTVVFILLNYDQIKLGAKGMFDDLKNALTPKKPVVVGQKPLV